MVTARRRPVFRARDQRAPDADTRPCDVPGCSSHGEYRAPRSRDALTEYYWFCLDHVREYNAHWNFYAGMNEEAIERQLRADTTWWRPTWPFGARGGLYGRLRNGAAYHWGMFGPDDDWDHEPIQVGDGVTGLRPRPGSTEERALAVLELQAPVTRDAVKARYKVLVKLHHPDANGGSKESEERLKVINQAYSALMHSAAW